VLPYLTTTKSGICGYRRRVPTKLKNAIGKTEIVKSFESADRNIVKLRHAEFHAGIERLFSEAKTKAGISSDLRFEAVVRSLRSRGLPSSEHADAWTAQDRTDAVDVVLADAGLGSLNELEEALETASSSERDKLRQVSTEVAIVQGTLARPRSTLTYCLRLRLEDKAKGRDVERKDWLRYKRERERIIGDLVKMIGNKDISAVTRADARSFLTALEGRYASSSVKKQIVFVKALFDFGFHEFAIAGLNPFRKLVLAAREDENENGVSFTYHDVRALLTKVGTINEELQQIIRLLACTGARLAEICGLELQDIDAEACTISLRYNTIRRLKNKDSVRVIPIVDPQSMDVLQARVHHRSDANAADPVFPRYGRDDGSSSASAALGKWLTKIGLRDPKAEEVKTTHSLRHTFKDALRELNVHRDIANMLQGHTAGDAASGYGSSELIEAKRKVASSVWALITGEAVESGAVEPSG
jgi:integrase